MSNIKPTLAVALIVKNEEKHLRACLDTVAGWVDEIVILDSGSTDATETIAREYTDNFYVNTDWPGFGKQRQLAQSYIQSDYVLWLDADERVSEQLVSSIKHSIETADSQDVFQVKRLSYFFGRFIRYSGWYPDTVVRLYRCNKYQYDDALVHEKVLCPAANIKTLEGDLLHYTATDFREYMTKSIRYADDWADERLRRGKKASLATAFIHSAAAFLRKYLIQRGFLDGRHGFLLAVTTSFYVFNKYTALWIKSR